MNTISITVMMLGLSSFAALPGTDGYGQPTFGSTMRQQSITIEAFRGSPSQPAPPPASDSSTIDTQPTVGEPPSPSNPSDLNIRQWRATPELCQLAGLAGAAPVLRAECEGEGQRRVHEPIECNAGQEPQGALFEQRRSGDTWTVPEIVEEESCLDPTQPSPDQQGEQQRRQIDIPAAAAHAFQNMAIEPSTLAVQPPDGQTLVNLDTIAYAEDEPRVLNTTLFGIPVSIRAVPDIYTWHWGDGTSSRGTDPGAPYPNHTVAHAYSAPGTATISLTTTWRGQFRLPGDTTWRDVPGQATTTSQSPPIEIREARTRLVEDLSH